MKLDHKKLHALLSEEITSLKDGCGTIASTFAIGKVGNVQIQVTVTRDRDSHMSNSKKFRCVEK